MYFLNNKSVSKRKKHFYSCNKKIPFGKVKLKFYLIVLSCFVQAWDKNVYSLFNKQFVKLNTSTNFYVQFIALPIDTKKL